MVMIMINILAQKVYGDYLLRVKKEIEAAVGQKGQAFLPKTPLETDFLPLLVLSNSLLVKGDPKKCVYRSCALSFVYFGARIHHLSSPNEAHAILFGDYFYSLFMDTLCQKEEYALLDPLAELLCVLSSGRLDRLDLNEKEVLRKEYGSLGKTASLLGVWDEKENLTAEAKDKLEWASEILGMLWGKKIENFKVDLAAEEEELKNILTSLYTEAENQSSPFLFSELYQALKEEGALEL